MLNAPRHYVDEIYLSMYLSVITYAPSEERRTDDVTYFARTFEVLLCPPKLSLSHVSLQYHFCIKHKGHEDKANDQKLNELSLNEFSLFAP